jgi:nitroreductase
MDFLDLVEKRRSTRQFQEREIDRETIGALVNIVNSAPSAGDLQSYEIVLISDKKNLAKLADAAEDQEFLKTAPAVLVFCADADRAKLKYGHKASDLFSIQDATIAATYAQLAAVDLGLATTWVGVFDERKVRRIVGGLKPVCMMPIGYAAENPEKTPRRPIQEFFHNEHL